MPPVTLGGPDGAQSSLALPCGLSYPSRGVFFFGRVPSPFPLGTLSPDLLAGPVGGSPPFLSVEALLELLVTSS